MKSQEYYSKHMDKIENQIKHFGSNCYEFFTSAYGWGIMFLSLLMSNDTTMLYSFLCSVLFADYVTGFVASYIEDREKGTKVYFLESSRLRASGVKVIGYFLIIVLTWFVSKFIYPENIRLFGVIREFNIHQLGLIMCIGIEFWSNIENVKRSGFDIIGKFESIVKKIWDLVKLARGRS